MHTDDKHTTAFNLGGALGAVVVLMLCSMFSGALAALAVGSYLVVIRFITGG